MDRPSRGSPCTRPVGGGALSRTQRRGSAALGAHGWRGNEAPHWSVSELSIPAIRIPWAHLDFSIARLGAVSIHSGYKMWRMPERAR